MPSTSNYFLKWWLEGKKNLISGQRSHKKKCNKKSNQNQHLKSHTSLTNYGQAKSYPAWSNVIEVWEKILILEKEDTKNKIISLFK